MEHRELEEDAYVRSAYFGVYEHVEELNELINKHAHGWKTTRISRVSRSILRLAVYEMLYCEDIPASVSLNEAIELAKKFEDEKARSFINGILNGIKTELGKE
jgi:N utilization substance protein B